MLLLVSVDNLMTPLVCLLSGLLQSQVGPRTCLLITCLPYLAGWVTAALAGEYHSLPLLYISRLLVGTGPG